MIDTHAHATDDRLKEILPEILENLGGELAAFVEVGSDFLSSKAAFELAKKHERVYAVLGIHPHDAETLDEEKLAFMREVAKHPKVVAIGEIGLDYHYENIDKDAQKRAFAAQLRLAHEVQLPVVIHLRDASADMLEILNENKAYLTNGILFHCHQASVEVTNELIKKYDPYFSFGGVITFKNAKKEELVRSVPQNRLLLETDCPYLTPEPLRGQLNRPEYVKYPAQRVEEILGLTYAEIEKLTTENALNFFGKMKI